MMKSVLLLCLSVGLGIHSAQGTSVPKDNWYHPAKMVVAGDTIECELQRLDYNKEKYEYMTTFLVDDDELEYKVDDGFEKKKVKVKDVQYVEMTVDGREQIYESMDGRLWRLLDTGCVRLYSTCEYYVSGHGKGTFGTETNIMWYRYHFKMFKDGQVYTMKENKLLKRTLKNTLKTDDPRIQEKIESVGKYNKHMDANDKVQGVVYLYNGRHCGE